MLRVGIAGAGNIGMMHSLAYTKIDNAKVIAVADADIKKANNMAAHLGAKSYYNAEDLIENAGIDLLDLCLPTILHKDFTIKALQKGINVLCEKPMALKVVDALEMEETAKASGAKLMIGHCLRFSAVYNLLKEAIEECKYGKLRSLKLYRHSPAPTWSAGNWNLDKEKSGGMAIDLHIHDSDMVLYLLGIPEAVLTYGDDMYISTFYDYPTATVNAVASWRNQISYPFSMGYDAFFEKASLVLNNNKLTIYETDGDPNVFDISDIEKTDDQKITGNVSESFLHMYINEIRYFIECVLNNKNPERSSPRDSRKSLEIILAELRSLKEKKKIVIS